MRFLVLLHHPMRNRHGEIVTTAVTNIDIHDLARTSLTYGMERLFLVTPIAEQHVLVKRIVDHWLTPESRAKHPDRAAALDRVELASTFGEVRERVMALSGAEPWVLMPDAAPIEGALDYPEASRLARTSERPATVVLGTGWGIAPEFYPQVDKFLGPILGSGSDYNHLSVRAAGAIICDRLFGRT
jgi:hypothetical protein